VLELPTSKALIFKRGVKPILADQFVYYRNAGFRQWSELKPPAESDQIRQGASYEPGLPMVRNQTRVPAQNGASSMIDLPPGHWRGVDETH
jgi:type IV secretory pathway TraG/TraD family ATPase VirD4